MAPVAVSFASLLKNDDACKLSTVSELPPFAGSDVGVLVRLL